MHNLTKIQIVTIVLIIAYILWEIVIRIWSKTQPSSGGALIRVDLMIIYPVLLILIIISLYQFFKR